MVSTIVIIPCTHDYLGTVAEARWASMVLSDNVCCCFSRRFISACMVRPDCSNTENGSLNGWQMHMTIEDHRNNLNSCVRSMETQTPFKTHMVGIFDQLLESMDIIS